jgi:hypothetical protein
MMKLLMIGGVLFSIAALIAMVTGRLQLGVSFLILASLWRIEAALSSAGGGK